jgi:hypothetical protein
MAQSCRTCRWGATATNDARAEPNEQVAAADSVNLAHAIHPPNYKSFFAV